MKLKIDINPKEFNLDHIFNCGQCFRWKKLEGFWYGVVSGKEIKLHVERNKLNIFVLNDIELNYEREMEFWINYFDLETDYSLIKKELVNVDAFLNNAIKKFSGIRILKQEFWETLCSFIISQNNNIPRIKLIIGRFCRHFGMKIKDDYSFPAFDNIFNINLNSLDVIKAGFRSNYILNAANKLKTENISFDYLNNLSNDKIVEILLKIKGVGVKIASCVLLYSFHRLNAFPVDVWVKRAMKENFNNKTSDIFGKFSGVAQQYLFIFKKSKF